jgi:hypothetical protein
VAPWAVALAPGGEKAANAASPVAITNIKVTASVKRCVIAAPFRQ